MNALVCMSHSVCVSDNVHTLKIITKGVCVLTYTSLLNVIEFTDNSLLSAADVRLVEALVIMQIITIINIKKMYFYFN